MRLLGSHHQLSNTQRFRHHVLRIVSSCPQFSSEYANPLYSSASRNASSLGEFFLRSNGSYAFAIDPQSSGNLLVTMNPDPSASTAILKWDLQTTDPTALSSVCFSNLTAEGTMLDIQVGLFLPYLIVAILTRSRCLSKRHRIIISIASL